MLLVMMRPYRRRKFGVFFNPESSLVSAKMLTAAENLGFFSSFGTIKARPHTGTRFWFFFWPKKKTPGTQWIQEGEHTDPEI